MIWYIWAILGIAAVYISVPWWWYQMMNSTVKYYIHWSENDGPFLLKHLTSEIASLRQRLTYLEFLIYGKSQKDPREARITGAEHEESEIEVLR